MTEKGEQLIHTTQTTKPVQEERLLPFVVACLVCFTIAVVLGTGSWFIFGSHKNQKGQTTAEIPQPSNSEQTSVAPLETPTAIVPMAETPAPPQPETAEKPKVENVVEVAGGEITIGGGNTTKPLERAIVKNFSISETEVTNAQYAEFIKAAKHPAPPGWKESGFPKGTENYPVTNVSYQDAMAFCKWLEKKIGLPVRLPTEAEWEFAARGSGEARKYPWGNEWNKEAARSEETGGKVSAVKSFSANRSPFGAFDMAGNVWEWTQEKVGKSEDVKDPRVKEALESGQVLRIVKGGSASEKAAQITVQARYEVPERTKNVWIGFRYVVETKPAT